MAYRFPLPSSDLQRTLVAGLHAAQEALDSYTGASDAARKLLRSLVLDRLALRTGGPHAKDHDRWPTKPARQLYVPASGNGTPQLREAGPCMFLKVADFNRNEDWRALKHSESSFDASEEDGVRIFEPGTVVFPKRGATIFHGKVGVLARPAALDPNLMALEVSSEQISPGFLYWLLWGWGLWRIADTTTVPQLNHKHLIPLHIPVPSTEEQKEICRGLSEATNAILAISRRQKKLRVVQRCMVHQGFGG